MIKKEIYPKTQRVKCTGESIIITEKIDGSNLVIFKLNNKLYIAQRNNIFAIDEIEENKDKLYKGLYQWLVDNGKELSKELNENSAICGEWIGMGKLKYPVDEFDKRYYIFAKANINEGFELNNIIYDHDLFIYPFVSKEIPKFIGIVPVVKIMKILPDKDQLDGIYEKYCESKKRNVEGFVIDYNNKITKYVRMKNGKLSEHFDRT